jgi:hypothetical protein
MSTLALSRLGHTWLIDVDGTLVAHNGHLQGNERLLPGVASFWQLIPEDDVIVLLSARAEAFRCRTLDFLQQQGLRFDHALFGLPAGERILINDSKPSGLKTALAVNLERDQGLGGCNVGWCEPPVLDCSPNPDRRPALIARTNAFTSRRDSNE